MIMSEDFKTKKHGQIMKHKFVRFKKILISEPIDSAIFWDALCITVFSISKKFNSYSVILFTKTYPKNTSIIDGF